MLGTFISILIFFAVVWFISEIIPSLFWLVKCMFKSPYYWVLGLVMIVNDIPVLMSDNKTKKFIKNTLRILFYIGSFVAITGVLIVLPQDGLRGLNEYVWTLGVVLSVWLIPTVLQVLFSPIFYYKSKEFK